MTLVEIRAKFGCVDGLATAAEALQWTENVVGGQQLVCICGGRGESWDRFKLQHNEVCLYSVIEALRAAIYSDLETAVGTAKAPEPEAERDYEAAYDELLGTLNKRVEP